MVCTCPASFALRGVTSLLGVLTTSGAVNLAGCDRKRLLFFESESLEAAGIVREVAVSMVPSGLWASPGLDDDGTTGGRTVDDEEEAEEEEEEVAVVVVVIVGSVGW